MVQTQIYRERVSYDQSNLDNLEVFTANKMKKGKVKEMLKFFEILFSCLSSLKYVGCLNSWH